MNSCVVKTFTNIFQTDTKNAQNQNKNIRITQCIVSYDNRTHNSQRSRQRCGNRLNHNAIRTDIGMYIGVGVSFDMYQMINYFKLLFNYKRRDCVLGAPPYINIYNINISCFAFNGNL